MDKLRIGNVELENRLFVGTGKFPSKQTLSDVIEGSGSKVVTIALRRVDTSREEHNILSYIPKDTILLPNTSGARNAQEAVRLARLARAMGCGNWIKIEVISDNKYLLPDNEETIEATRILSKEGFVVLPYMNPDLMSAKKLVSAGASAVMPLGAPIGTNRGIMTEEMTRIIIDEINEVPVIVDAGIGAPSHAAKAMEMGADAVLVNTAIATAQNPVQMARAFSLAVQAGRTAYIAKLGETSHTANASSPLTGFLHEEE